MKTEALVLLLGSLLLASLFVFRLQDVTRLGWCVAAFVAGLVIVQVVLGVVLSVFHLERQSYFLMVANAVKARLEKTSAQPVFLVGASRTARDVDGSLLERRMVEAGIHHPLVQLSYPGRYAFEQEFYLERLLKESGVKPKLMLIELGSDLRAALANVNRFKNEPIAFHDAPRVYEMLRIQLGLGDYEGALVSLRHMAAHYLNMGIARNLAREGSQVRLGFMPEEATPSAPSAERLAAELAQEGDTQRVEIAEVLLDFRRRQRARLERLGVEQVIYVHYPSAASNTRARLDVLCQRLQPCISLNDPGLRRQLNGPFWTDMGHLTAGGARILTEAYAKILVPEIGRHDAR